MSNPTARETREALALKGLPIPPELFPPTIITGYARWMEAFWELCSERNVSKERVGPIPVSAILLYADYLDLSDIDRECFLVIIRRLDGIFMRHETGQDTQSNVFNRAMLRGIGR